MLKSKPFYLIINNNDDLHVHVYSTRIHQLQLLKVYCYLCSSGASIIGTHLLLDGEKQLW